MPFEFVHLCKALGTWDKFVRDWESQCSELEEDFSCYELEPIGVVKDLAEGPVQPDAAAYALYDGERYAAMCQVNRTLLPGYTGQVLRVRMLYLSPYYEFGEFSLEQYSRVLIDILFHIIELSREAMPSRHIKFHLRSPADRQFFAAFRNAIDGTGVFESVTTRGAWLYITKN
jgi:hypothetical protein